MRHVRMVGLCLVAVFAVSAALAASALASEPPTVAKVEPTTVPTAPQAKGGGVTPLWIHGTGFAGNVTVKVGSQEAADVEVISETEIEVRAPREAPEGEYEVVVEDENGVSSGGPQISYIPTEKPDVSWSKFKNCALHEEYEGNPAKHCDYAATRKDRGGFYTVGGITVPVTKSIVLQGGATEEGAIPPVEEQYSGMEFILPPEDGVPAIAPVPEKVPVEVLNNVSEAEMNEFGWPQNLRESYKLAQKKHYFKANKTTETIESAGSDPQYLSTYNGLAEEGPEIIASVQIKGENPWLTLIGGSCLIGSEAEPVVQHLATGESVSPLTGERIHGKGGFAGIYDEYQLAALQETRLVDNTYAVPAATKCGGTTWERYLDPVVNKAFGLPAPAGASTTVLEGAEYTAHPVEVEKRGL